MARSSAQAELDGLLRKGTVGDIALRYYDSDGRCIESDINDRIIGITLEQLKHAQGGGRLRWTGKVAALRAALRGGLVNVLITDSVTADRLLEQTDG